MLSAYASWLQKSEAVRYSRVLGKEAAKALQGCSAHSNHLPMARASRLVVATTSLVLAFMKTCSPRHNPLSRCPALSNAIREFLLFTAKGLARIHPCPHIHWRKCETEMQPTLLLTWHTLHCNGWPNQFAA